MTLLRPWALALLLVVSPVGEGVADGATIGAGTPGSCTSAAVVSAVARGGVVRFDCGPAPVTIRMRQTAKVRNTSSSVVLDGGGKVTLSGGGARRILYQNTCDRAQVWTTDHCDNQATPRLTVRNITLANGNSTGQTVDGGGGGAIFVRGGRLTIIDARFTGNRCGRTGPDLGGAAVRALSQFRNLPVRVVRSTFTGGPLLQRRRAEQHRRLVADLRQHVHRQPGDGAWRQPSRAGAPGGGSGGAIYLDGNRFTLSLRDTTMRDNVAPEGGGAIFFVSNDRTGTPRSRHRRCGTTRASASRPRASRASSSWAPAARR